MNLPYQKKIIKIYLTFFIFKMTYVDLPDKKQKESQYEQQLIKLDSKNNEFSSKKFQKFRKLSKQKKLLNSFQRIGMCLNQKYVQSIPIQNLTKVCFILINDYDEEEDRLGVGPLNDGYLIGLKHFKIGYKVFYLYNCPMHEFPYCFGFFLRNTKEKLTVFYSGRDDKMMGGIEFENGTLFTEELTEVINKYSNKNLQVTYITDITSSGSVFNINNESNAISFYVNKTTKKKQPKEVMLTHGIFTYYFCKITNCNPDVTPNQIVDQMNPLLSRFGEELKIDCSNKELSECPIFSKSEKKDVIVDEE